MWNSAYTKGVQISRKKTSSTKFSYNAAYIIYNSNSSNFGCFCYFLIKLLKIYSICW